MSAAGVTAAIVREAFAEADAWDDGSQSEPS